MTVDTETEVGIRELKAHATEYVNRAHYGGRITYVTKNGKPFAAIVPIQVVEAAELAEVGPGLDAALDAKASA